MKAPEVTKFIEQITHHEQFINEVRRCVQQCHSPQNGGELPTFAFQKAAKYPWTMYEGNMTMEGQMAVEEITGMIATLIDHNMHDILNREFINVTNEILVMREEMDSFRREQIDSSRALQEELKEQVEALRKKMIIQQGQASERKEFARSRASGLLNSSHTSTTAVKSQEIESLRKEMEILKDAILKSPAVEAVNDKVVYLEERLQAEIQTLKIKYETTRQKNEKALTQLIERSSEKKNKEIMMSEVQRAVKGHFKVYLEEINSCKFKIVKLETDLGKTDRGLQEYIGNQLKTVWVMISNLKRRQEELQENSQLNNQSFILE